MAIVTIPGHGGAHLLQVAEEASLPQAAIVFDRFHIMQMFSQVIRNCRRAEFKAARSLGDLSGQQVIKGSLWLRLSNHTSLKQTDQERLNQLLAQNQLLATLYALKESCSNCGSPTRRAQKWLSASMTGAAWPRRPKSPDWLPS
jgi:transposase